MIAKADHVDEQGRQWAKIDGTWYLREGNHFLARADVLESLDEGDADGESLDDVDAGPERSEEAGIESAAEGQEEQEQAASAQPVSDVQAVRAAGGPRAADVTELINEAPREVSWKVARTCPACHAAAIKEVEGLEALECWTVEERTASA